MLKKFFVATIACLIACVTFKAQAAEIYAGNSPATGWNCYVLTDSIRRVNEHDMLITYVTLKMVDGSVRSQYLNYTFFDLYGDGIDVEFTNTQGYRGVISPTDTPIEWAMYKVCMDY